LLEIIKIDFEGISSLKKSIRQKHDIKDGLRSSWMKSMSVKVPVEKKKLNSLK
jgi:hypothetical protein